MAGMTNSEISRRLNIPKSTASYILRTLEQNRYISRDRSTGRYRLGLKLLALGRGVQIGREIREVARPILRRLVERSGLTAHLAVLDHGEAVYIEKSEAAGFIKLDTWIGRRMDLHSTAVGKALAAFMQPFELESSIGERDCNTRRATHDSRFTIHDSRSLVVIIIPIWIHCSLIRRNPENRCNKIILRFYL